MSSSPSTPLTVRERTQEVLQANKDHQYALKVYTERLEAELEAVNKLLVCFLSQTNLRGLHDLLCQAAAEAPDDEPDVDVGGHLELAGAAKALGPIPPEIAPGVSGVVRPLETSNIDAHSPCRTTRLPKMLQSTDNIYNIRLCILVREYAYFRDSS